MPMQEGKSRKRLGLEMPWLDPVGAAEQVRKVSVEWWGKLRARGKKRKCEVGEGGSRGSHFGEAWLQREGKGVTQQDCRGWVRTEFEQGGPEGVDNLWGKKDGKGRS